MAHIAGVLGYTRLGVEEHARLGLVSEEVRASSLQRMRPRLQYHVGITLNFPPPPKWDHQKNRIITIITSTIITINDYYYYYYYE